MMALEGVLCFEIHTQIDVQSRLHVTNRKAEGRKVGCAQSRFRFLVFSKQRTCVAIYLRTVCPSYVSALCLLTLTQCW